MEINKILPYIIGFFLVLLMAYAIMIFSKKSTSRVTLDSNLDVDVDVNNSVAVRNSMMANQVLKSMLTGNKEPMPYGINEKDKLY